MNIIKKLIFFPTLLFFAGCASAIDVSKPISRGKLPSSYALQGTNTAVVGIAIDKKGIPLETVKEIVLKPGQRAIFAGPDEFQIIFKDKKVPEKEEMYRSINGVVTVNVPRDILDRPEFKDEYEKNKQVVFNYAIRIKDKELDPPFIIKRDD